MGSCWLPDASSSPFCAAAATGTDAATSVAAADFKKFLLLFELLLSILLISFYFVAREFPASALQQTGSDP